METYKNVMEIELNPENPRKISDKNRDRLVNSLLCFPDMLSLRPVIVNADGVVLGGNMRTSALRDIAVMEDAEIAARLEDSSAKGIISWDAAEELKEYWSGWKENPEVKVSDAGGMLSQTEEKEFVVKDNLSYGYFDFDKLESWDKALLSDMGMDDWTPDGDINVDVLDYFKEGGTLMKGADEKPEKSTFLASFLVPKSVRDKYNQYIAKTGKIMLENLIQEYICQDVEAR